MSHTYNRGKPPNTGRVRGWADQWKERRIREFNNGENESNEMEPTATAGSSVHAKGPASGRRKAPFPKWNTWKDFWKGRVPPATGHMDKEDTPEVEKETQLKETGVSTTTAGATGKVRCFFCHTPGHFAHQCVIRSQERLEGKYRSTIGDTPLTRKEWGKLSYDQKTGSTRGNRVGENIQTGTRSGAGN